VTTRQFDMTGSSPHTTWTDHNSTPLHTSYIDTTYCRTSVTQLLAGVSHIIWSEWESGPCQRRSTGSTSFKCLYYSGALKLSATVRISE